MILNMGPQHPSTHGVLRVLLEIDGETVVRIMPDIGFLHTGIEKTCEAKFYQQVVPLTDRIDYLCPMTNNLCYVLAVEKLLGLEIPPKAQWMRVLMNELTRINSHLVWLGTHAMDIGALTVFLYCFREREEVLKMFEMISGQRMMTSYFRVGGLALEPPLGFFERVGEFAGYFAEKIDEYENLLTGNPIWMMRTKGVARLTAEDAIALGASGPTLRGSGVDIDLRRDMPYSGYENFNFKVPVAQEGDVFARYMCRVRELRESNEIVKQALDGMPEGPIKADAPGVVLPDREKMKTQMEALKDVSIAMNNTKLFDESERATLALTYEMTRTITVAQPAMARVRAILPDQQVVELVGTIAGYNMVSRFLVATGIEVEE